MGHTGARTFSTKNTVYDIKWAQHRKEDDGKYTQINYYIKFRDEKLVADRNTHQILYIESYHTQTHTMASNKFQNYKT